MTFLDIPAADYHADRVGIDEPCLNAGIASLLLKASPAHAWHAHPKLNPDWQPREAKKFDLGKVAHEVILEGEAKVHLVMANSWNTNAAKEERAIARLNGLTAMLVADWDRVREMTGAFWRNLNTMNVEPRPLIVGKPERTIVWHEPNGIACKARIDWLHDDLSAVDDLKTTSASANPESWTRNTLYSIGADVQAAWYLRGLERLTGKRPEWRFVVVETFPPYALSVVSPGPSVFELAEAKINRALELWAECLSSGVWPAYPQRVCWAEAPAWELARWTEREVREAA